MKFKGSCSRIALSVFGVPAILVLAGCGGGGGSSPTPTASPPPVQTAPSITSASTTRVTENVTGGFYTATATDPQNDPITWEVFSGADASSFIIDGSGVLTFQDSPNFDLPEDANQDNVYEVSLRATAGGETDLLSLRVTVDNDKEGIDLRRIVTGLVDPVSISSSNSGRGLLIAEKAGRVLFLDTDTGNLEEDILIRDNRRPGEIIAAYYAFSGFDQYGEGVILITHQPGEGLMMQVFDPEGRDFQFLPFGDPWAEPVKAAMIDLGERVLLAVGDPGGSLAQTTSSAYGKLFSITPLNPYALASVPSAGTRLHRLEMIGDGLRQPGGIGIFNAELVMADQGDTAAHGLTLFRADWRPLDFGWPFYEGAVEVRADAPARINGPKVSYELGNGRGEGLGPIPGFSMPGAPSGLQDQYTFFDVSGKVFSVPNSVLTDSNLHFGNELEDRTLDFEPDAGKIDNPVAATRSADGAFFIDADGEVFALFSS